MTNIVTTQEPEAEKDRRVVLLVPNSLVAGLDRVTEELGASRSELIRRAIKRDLEARGDV
jgi:metal-responsive CopG/Arc/MetJ family transcriptional regulator